MSDLRTHAEKAMYLFSQMLDEIPRYEERASRVAPKLKELEELDKKLAATRDALETVEDAYKKAQAEYAGWKSKLR